MIAEAYKTRFYFSDKGTQKGDKILSLFFSNEQVAFAILDENGSHVSELADLTIENVQDLNSKLEDKLEFVTRGFNLLNTKFNRTYITFLNSDFTLLPEAYHSQDLSKSLLNFSSGTASRKIIKMANGGVQLIAGLDNDVFNFTERNFPNAIIRHSGNVTLSLLRAHHSLQAADVFLNLHPAKMELCALKAGKLQFYNVFPCATDEDILYYLLFALEQFGYDPGKVNLTLAGEKTVDSPLFSALRKYFSNIHYTTQHPSLRLNGDLSRLPSHFYFTLLNQHSCE